MGGAGAILGTLALIAGIVFGGWQLGWWFQRANNTRSNELIQQGYSNQLTLSQQVTSKLAEVENITVQIAKAGNDTALTAALFPQRAAIASIVCQDADQIQSIQLPADQLAWIGANCEAGSLSPNSSLYQAGQ
ncbi:hypothetical protein EAS64_33695 [Trebonia kvetii]|uniref:Uncharacterized protein n=1 Tax=Trebonia kvetii TaxID=2480626 RepID=A0A6P2BSV9_9ACTN|nr:hypothetical protein [Trebonia kvetii]TVZ01235.1 hypothetical protein EAS64_33695 [Trebonia kvetii]